MLIVALLGIGASRPDETWIEFVYVVAAVLVAALWLRMEVGSGLDNPANLARKLAEEHKWATNHFLVPLAAGADLGSIRREGERWASMVMGLMQGRAPGELVRNFNAIISPHRDRHYIHERDDEHRVFLTQINIRLEAYTTSLSIWGMTVASRLRDVAGASSPTGER